MRGNHEGSVRVVCMYTWISCVSDSLKTSLDSFPRRGLVDDVTRARLHITWSQCLCCHPSMAARSGARRQHSPHATYCHVDVATRVRLLRVVWLQREIGANQIEDGLAHVRLVHSQASSACHVRQGGCGLLAHTRFCT